MHACICYNVYRMIILICPDLLYVCLFLVNIFQQKKMNEEQNKKKTNSQNVLVPVQQTTTTTTTIQAGKTTLVFILSTLAPNLLA